MSDSTKSKPQRFTRTRGTINWSDSRRVAIALTAAEHASATELAQGKRQSLAGFITELVRRACRRAKETS